MDTSNLQKFLIYGFLVVLFLVGFLIFMFMNDSNKKEEVSGDVVDNSKKVFNGAVFKTNVGDFEIVFEKAAPLTVENFIKLAESGFYNSTRFHRVIDGFMIQGGDPLSKDISAKEMWGTGGPGYSFKDEIHQNNLNKKGTIAMANAGPNTNGSQFFVNVNDNDFLNDKHTVFGNVISGYDVVLKISQTKRDASDRPESDIIIESIELK